MVVKVLTKMVYTVQAQVMMYKAVVHTMLLYGRESWVVIDVMLKFMEGFHHQVAQRIAGMSSWRVMEG